MFKIKVKCRKEDFDRITTKTVCLFLKVHRIDCVGFNCTECKQTFINWDIHEEYDEIPKIKITGTVEQMDEAVRVFKNLGYTKIKREVVE